MAEYGKRPVWQWILIYAVVGIIIYVIIYYFVIARSGGYSNPNAPAQNTQQNVPSGPRY